MTNKIPQQSAWWREPRLKLSGAYRTVENTWLVLSKWNPEEKTFLVQDFLVDEMGSDIMIGDYPESAVLDWIGEENLATIYTPRINKRTGELMGLWNDLTALEYHPETLEPIATSVGRIRDK